MLKQTAHIKDPLVEAALGGFYRLPTEAAAQAKIEELRANLIV